MSDTPPQKKQDPGAPAWAITFADLMSLLMSFFVLLLSFSEMDVLKFKQIAGSLSHAFGVQREIKAKEIPKGLSVIAKEFSAGKPDPTIMNEVRQHTTDENKKFLDVGDMQDVEALIKEVHAQVEEDAAQIKEAFKDEIESGLIEVETEEQRIIIRIREKGSFPSGSAVLIGGFEPIVAKISGVLKGTDGKVIVAGHTDNIPIANARFRSNWELSAARAVSVLHHLLATKDIEADRFLIEGYGESRPVVPNDSRANRALNRRVEIVLIKGTDQLLDDVSLGATPKTEPDTTQGLITAGR